MSVLLIKNKDITVNKNKECKKIKQAHDQYEVWRSGWKIIYWSPGVTDFKT